MNENVNFLILCCTARSGSTTLLRILNTIPRVNICGENDNAIINLLQCYNSLKTSINYRKSYDKSSSLNDFIDNKLCPAWYNTFDYNMVVNEVKSLIIKILKKNDEDNLLGFKEIRFYNNLHILELFIELFPNTKFIVNVRRDIAKQANSNHYKSDNKAETIKYLNNYTNQLINFYRKHKDTCTLMYFEDLFNTKHVKKIFKFLDKEEYFDVTKIENVLSQNYSTIYFRYDYMLPKGFSPYLYKTLNNDLASFSDFDLIKHYVEYGKLEKRKYQYNSTIHTIVKDEEFILNEWICYNVLLGFDHIYIYDDRSIIPVNDTLSFLPEKFKKHVTVFRINDDVFNEYKDESIRKEYNINKQKYLMNYFLKNHVGVSKWCAFIDVDEFIELKYDTNINTFLLDYDDEDAIVLPYISYGTSYFIDQPKGLIVDNFTRHNDKYQPLGKTICKLSQINSIDNCHKFSNNSYEFTTNTKSFMLPIHINHYETCSLKTYLRRKMRPEIGMDFQLHKSPEYVLSVLLSNNDTDRPFELPFSTELRKIFNFDANCASKKQSDCFNIFVVNNQILYLKNKSINKELISELYASDVRYAQISDIINIPEFIEFKTTHTFHNLNKAIEEFCKIKNDLKYFESYTEQIICIKSFNPTNYKKLNSDLVELSNDEATEHFINHGIKEKRIYELKLPHDFNVDNYRELNPDLKNMTDVQLMSHYQLFNYENERIYKLNLPEDFNVDEYKRLNPDLCNLDDLVLKKHYSLHGEKENRLYKEILPNNFLVSCYRFLNPDIDDLSDLELKVHYQKYGIFEERKYVDTLYDPMYFKKKYFNKQNLTDDELYKKYTLDIKLHKSKKVKHMYDKLILPKKNTIFFVDHDKNGYGACHYLYLLFNICKEKYKTINFVLIVINYVPQLEEKYSILKSETIEYLGDPSLLYMLYNKIKPLVMYMNSANYAMYRIINVIPRNKIIFHSHEIKSHYLLHQAITPDYVVSEKISSQYIKKPKIQPPFLSEIHKILELANEPVDPIKNKYGCLDNKKITITMCGSITERKNYKLFIEVSKMFHEHNFLWIGGNETDIFYPYKNIYHVPLTQNPYKYYKQCTDYFILFSLIDPCPFVILENILLGVPCIVFEENIFVKHDKNILKEYYHEISGEINLLNCSNAINMLVKSKNCAESTCDNNAGYHYICKNYSYPTYIVSDIEQFFQKKTFGCIFS